MLHFYIEPSHGINAIVDFNDYWVIQVIYIFKLKPHVNENILYMLGILNSRLMYFYYYETFGEKNKKAFPHVRQTQILELPIPNIDLNNPNDKQKHDDIVKLVDTMLELNKSIKSAGNQSDETSITRIIEATDRRIDGIVYSLYGLSEEEIKIVEGE